MKLFFYILREFFVYLWEAFLKRLPFRHKICWLVGHLYPGIYIKKEYSALESPQGVIVADTEAGCIYCGEKKTNQWPEYQLDRNRKL